MQTLHTIERNGNFVAHFANDAISLNEGEHYVVALTLRQKPTGHLPKVSVYGTTFHLDHDINDYVDDTPLTELDVTKVYFDDNDLVVEIRNSYANNVDPMLFDITW